MVWILFMMLCEQNKSIQETLSNFLKNEVGWLRSKCHFTLDLTVKTPCHKPMSFLQSNTLTSVSPTRESTMTHKRHRHVFEVFVTLHRTRVLVYYCKKKAKLIKSLTVRKIHYKGVWLKCDKSISPRHRFHREKRSILDKGQSPDLHSSCRPGSEPDSESAWRSWTQQLPSLFPPYSLCTVVIWTQRG